MPINKKLNAPLFGVGFKAYVWGKKALELAKIIEKVAERTDVYIHVIPQLIDVSVIAKETSLPVFVPHMSSIKAGRGTGQILPESVKECGAVGAMLNHVEHRISLTEIDQTIKRAKELGLYSMVCADTPEEARAIATFEPEIIVSEPPALIGTLKSVGNVDKDFVIKSVRMVKSVNPKTLLICGGGVASGNDVREMIKLGADGTGASRSIDESNNPRKTLEEMIKALEKEWISRR
jgi:triosephosphate isomerase